MAEAVAKRARKDTSPPVYKSLENVYLGSAQKAAERYNKIKEKFVAVYGSPPTFFARAPGRVNIIGEHIDYCGYGVLPMAVEQDIVMAVTLNNEGKIKLANTEPQFSEFTSDCLDYKIDGKEWCHYFLCGYKGIVDHLKIAKPVGMNVVADGTVPKSAGLSSSSAMVCCSGLATLQANGLELSKHDLAEVCTKCERYIGTEGGGMDQSCSFLAEPGTAKHIEFNPIRAHDVKLPDGVAFVVGNCLVEMTKSLTAGTHFNVRVVECRLAAKVLAKAKELDWQKIRRLEEVQSALKASLDDMVSLVESILHREPYTKDELCKFFGLNEADLVKECMSESTAAVNSFKLYDRAKHVYSEAGRVLRFKQVCNEGNGYTSKILGDLMNESHESCSKSYECSCDELDQLVSICRKAGALGSRLTGAGWGGCTVSLVPANKVEAFMKQVHDEYYAPDPKRLAKVSESLFATVPGSGAAILTLTN